MTDTRMPALDGVRGVAVLWVLMHQLSWPLAATGMTVWLARPVQAGWIGVQLFFVLSGFLITGILLDSQADPRQLRHFYLRRALRIFPLYYASLGLSMCALASLPAPTLGVNPEAERNVMPWLLTFLSNWTAYLDRPTDLFTHFWSLAVEEQFYLLWPLLIWRRTPQAVLRLAMALATLSLLSRIGLARWGPHGDNTVLALYTFTPCRLDALALGGAAAACLRSPTWLAMWRRHAPRLGLLTGAALLVALPWTHGFEQDSLRTQLWGYSLLAWSFACWMLWLVTRAPRPRHPWLGLQAPWLRRVGEVSFGMYVMHLPVHQLLGRWVMHSMGWGAPVSLAFNLAYALSMTLLLYALARLSYRFWEMPFLRLKDRIAAYAPARVPT